ncbi:hypothetical protein [Frondihabitans sp. PAMC 28766]|uniref:glycosyl hydrolase 2 galactose-binding domain-containing protein n=1 Tax=Frondihabitans sp. PAMC 28766 TaxID=1795630 RepID=UPI000B086091|nr:hypothetical protein [Frondihabitans sp. PAMC 28766]
MIRSTLTDGWRLTLVDGPIPDGLFPAGSARTVPATVPGTVHTDLLAAGLIADPYIDLNEQGVQWIGRTDVRYDLDLEIDRAGHERVDLVAEGLDTIATLTLDGTEIGRTRNQHRSYRFDLRSVLDANDRDSRQSKSSHLSIDFASALTYAEQAQDRLGARPFVGNAYPYNAIRKMACNFGWDWGPVLITAGIWKPIRIEAWSTARLASVRPVVTVDGAGRIDLHVELERTGAHDVEIDVEVTDPAGRRVATARRTLSADTGTVTLDVADPALWWPRGHGDQPLYEVTAVLSTDGAELDRWSRHIGFRTVSVDLTPTRSAPASPSQSMASRSGSRAPTGSRRTASCLGSRRATTPVASPTPRTPA